MLGYGGTSKLTQPEEYSTKKLCADLAALLDLLGVRKAVCSMHLWLAESLTCKRLSLVTTGARSLLAVSLYGTPIACLP